MDSQHLVAQPPQTEEASVVKVAGASSNPLAEVKVKVAPQNNDSHRNEDPQVGDCLIQFKRAWVEESCSTFTFCLKLRLNIHSLIISRYKAQHNDLALWLIEKLSNRYLQLLTVE